MEKAEGADGYEVRGKEATETFGCQIGSSEWAEEMARQPEKVVASCSREERGLLYRERVYKNESMAPNT